MIERIPHNVPHQDHIYVGDLASTQVGDRTIAVGSDLCVGDKTWEVARITQELSVCNGTHVHIYFYFHNGQRGLLSAKAMEKRLKLAEQGRRG